MQKSNLIYNIQDKPPFGKTLIFALQQLLAIMAATIAVPAIIGNGMSAAAALFGAGAGTLIYLLFTKFKSPVFLGSSFAFLGSMSTAFAGAVTVELGYLGLILGAIFAGLVYVVIAFVVKRVGTAWISKIMPPQVIGPTVAIIGLSLSGNAIGDLFKGSVLDITLTPTANPYIALVCGLVTLFVVIICSLYGKKMISMIPFIMGILAGYLVATIFTVIGLVTENPALQVIDFAKFQNIQWYPDFSFIKALGGFEKIDGAYIGTVAVAYVPVAFVVFAEHIADHKNLSTIIGHDLITDPGLDRTLLGDGVGSMVGAIFGGCPNTTYGESVGCVAISKNASVITIVYTAIMAMLISFVGPFSTFLATIPSCVMGGVCVALYGFIAVSGLKMLQKVDLQDNRNLFVVSTILIAGVGGMKLTFGKVTITSVACALILGILVNVVAHAGDKKAQQTEEPQAE
ncbi:MAG: uracil-xanthine permease [Clostridia bacterium]|nr:uracil-xanthine permease [Clostridia bacterium]